MRARAIIDTKELVDVIQRSRFCHLSLVDEQGKPYVLPMNFGFRDGVIYLHGAQHGRKIDILKNNPSVCINFTTDHLLRYQNEEVACSWSMKYRSVLCFGEAEFITGPEEKIAAFHIVMAQYTDGAFKFNPPAIREVCVWKIRVERMEGRAYGY
jgi:nitroimidazol reductase NimA-like FMN-containing flavoprotein (pyridoxamine 5'-phosphate oxidase superfamily)